MTTRIYLATLLDGTLGLVNVTPDDADRLRAEMGWTLTMIGHGRPGLMPGVLAEAMVLSPKFSQNVPTDPEPPR